MRRPYLPADRVASLQVKLANLRGRNVNVVGSWQIVVIRRTQETITVRKNFQHTFSKDVAFLFTLRLQNLENEVLLAHPAGARKIECPGDLGQFGYVFFFEFCNGHELTCEEISELGRVVQGDLITAGQEGWAASD